MTTLILLIIIIALIPSLIKEQKQQNKMKSYLAENSIFANDYIYEKNNLIKKGYNTDGIYIFTNIDRGNHKYVGQSINVIKRVDTHLRGRGNADVYNHMINGDRFVIEFIKLQDTSFYDLNSLEKYYITKYNSYHNGYNRTRGNRSVA